MAAVVLVTTVAGGAIVGSLWQQHSSNQACANSDRVFNAQRIDELRKVVATVPPTDERRFKYYTDCLKSQQKYERAWQQWDRSSLVNKALHSCPSWSDWND